MTARNQEPAALAIVVPTYNERDRLKDLVDRIFASYAIDGIDGEIVIVDDNSPDGTGALADELAARYRITVLHRAGKMGLGTAVIEGFAAASAPVVGVIDADLSHPPDLLPRMRDAPAAAPALASRSIRGASPATIEAACVMQAFVRPCPQYSGPRSSSCQSLRS